MRAKFKLNSVKTVTSSYEVLNFSAVGPSGAYPEDGTDENNTFAKFTPSASCEISVTNPALVGKFKEGQTFYVDFTPAD